MGATELVLRYVVMADVLGEKEADKTENSSTSIILFTFYEAMSVVLSSLI